jgi:hypothetical protein
VTSFSAAKSHGQVYCQKATKYCAIIVVVVVVVAAAAVVVVVVAAAAATVVVVVVVSCGLKCLSRDVLTDMH